MPADWDAHRCAVPLRLHPFKLYDGIGLVAPVTKPFIQLNDFTQTVTQTVSRTRTHALNGNLPDQQSETHVAVVGR
jgi:hypothetical protein